MITNVRQLIAKHEGRVNHAYQDNTPEKYWTIGVGHLIDARKGGSIPDQIIDALLDYDIQLIRTQLSNAIPWWLLLDFVRQAVVLDMAFNLGVPGLLTFKNTLAAIHDNEYVTAAGLMLQSKWASQVPERAKELAAMMKSGKWPT